jgi:hypothetical protein
MSMKNSNDTIGIRNRDLPACSAVPQPRALPRAPYFLGMWDNYGQVKLVNEGVPTYFEVIFQHFYEGAEELNRDK